MLTQELNEMKVEILENIKTAAKEGNVESISKWSKTAEECELLILELNKIKDQISLLKKKIWPEQNNKKRQPNYSHAKIKLSPKQEGAKLRSMWVKELAIKNINLKGHGKNYYTENGMSVGIASANELNRKQLSGKWFLGLKDEVLDVVVLLCRDLNKKLYDIIIPIDGLGGLWQKLSRSNGQIKFHIHLNNCDFYLSIPGENPIKINKYIGNYEPLR